jgi:hypothetical protein
MELRRALLTHRMAQRKSRTNFAHGFRVSMPGRMFFPSEASYEEESLVFPAV